MIYLLDRMMFWAVVRAYCICLISTLSLYIIVDLFTNLDNFTTKADGVADSLYRIVYYYGFRSIQYFDRLAEVLGLLAGMFAIAWMQRSNELLPMLSAGVSTHRVIRPIILTSGGFILFGSFVQEMVIPHPIVSNALQAERDDLQRSKDVIVQGVYDTTGCQLEGVLGNPRTETIQYFFATIPESATNSMIHLSANVAEYVPTEAGKELSGGFLLTETQPLQLPERNRPPMLTWLAPGKYFLKTKEVTFRSMIRPSRWMDYLSTWQIYHLLESAEGKKNASLAVTFHMRLTRPIVGVLLVIAGLSIILRDQTRHVFISTGLCMIVAALFFGLQFAARALGTADVISPPLAAWLPVILFGPITIANYDSIHS